MSDQPDVALGRATKQTVYMPVSAEFVEDIGPDPICQLDNARPASTDPDPEARS